MDRTEEFPSPTTFNEDEPSRKAEPAQPKIDPDNPPWSLGMAILVWLGSFLLLAILGLVFLLPYAAARGITADKPEYARVLSEFAAKDQTAIFLQLFSTLPAHLLTIGLVWALVTGLGKRPFWETLGWSWSRRFGLWLSIATGIVLFFASQALAMLGGQKTTPLELVVNSSAAARYTIVFLATLTAPLTEEFVFRGVLYSPLQRLFGPVVGVLVVVTLFTAVHIPQYRSNLGVIAAVGLLSLALTVIRALSGRLLPCFVVHLVFNGIQSAIMLIRPNATGPTVNSDHAGIILPMLARLICPHI